MQTCSLHHLQQKVSSEEFAQIDISMIKLALKFPLSEGISSRHTAQRQRSGAHSRLGISTAYLRFYFYFFSGSIMNANLTLYLPPSSSNLTA